MKTAAVSNRLHESKTGSVNHLRTNISSSSPSVITAKKKSDRAIYSPEIKTAAVFDRLYNSLSSLDAVESLKKKNNSTTTTKVSSAAAISVKKKFNRAIRSPKMKNATVFNRLYLSKTGNNTTKRSTIPSSTTRVAATSTPKMMTPKRTSSSITDPPASSPRKIGLTARKLSLLSLSRILWRSQKSLWMSFGSLSLTPLRPPLVLSSHRQTTTRRTPKTWTTRPRKKMLQTTRPHRKKRKKKRTGTHNRNPKQGTHGKS